MQKSGFRGFGDVSKPHCSWTSLKGSLLVLMRQLFVTIPQPHLQGRRGGGGIAGQMFLPLNCPQSEGQMFYEKMAVQGNTKQSAAEEIRCIFDDI